PVPEGRELNFLQRDLDRLANELAQASLEFRHPALVESIEHGHSAAHDAIASYEVVRLRRTGGGGSALLEQRLDFRAAHERRGRFGLLGLLVHGERATAPRGS